MRGSAGAREGVSNAPGALHCTSKETGKGTQNRVETIQVTESSRVGSSRVESSRVKSSQVESSQVEQVTSSQVKSSHVKKSSTGKGHSGTWRDSASPLRHTRLRHHPCGTHLVAGEKYRAHAQGLEGIDHSFGLGLE